MPIVDWNLEKLILVIVIIRGLNKSMGYRVMEICDQTIAIGCVMGYIAGDRRDNFMSGAGWKWFLKAYNIHIFSGYIIYDVIDPTGQTPYIPGEYFKCPVVPSIHCKEADVSLQFLTFPVNACSLTQFAVKTGKISLP